MIAFQGPDDHIYDHSDNRYSFMLPSKSLTTMLVYPFRLARGLQDHNYIFNPSKRPPTPTLDQLTQYLQVGVLQARHAGGCTGPPGYLPLGA